MKKIALFSLTLAFALGLSNVSALARSEDNIRERKIVVFHKNLSEAEKDEALSRAGGEKIKNLNLTGARAVRISRAEENRLKNNPAVERVDNDIIVKAFGKAGVLGRPVPAILLQVTPWGILKINAPIAGNTADLVKVGIIDTGISNTHPDLLANIKGGVNTINPFKNWNDDNGHGSHVAGIIAGLDNNFGIVGAAPQADLYAIKALNSKGSGYLSDIIEGLGWAKDNGIQVVNLSLGSSSNVISFHDAIIAAKNAGITVVAAAGNSGGAVSYPAAYPEAIAVSATDKNNIIAYFSSRGSEIDIAAPGVSIYSTYKGIGYATLSGTSMAAPHVVAVAALVISQPVAEAYDMDNDDKWDPSEVQKKLEDSATSLGDAKLYGAGLVNAWNAVQ